jgi:hypothetical protein
LRAISGLVTNQCCQLENLSERNDSESKTYRTGTNSTRQTGEFSRNILFEPAQFILR